MRRILAHRHAGTCISLTAVLALLALVALQLHAVPPASAATPWNAGDVFVAVSNGAYKVYDNAGNFKQTISSSLGGVTTGCTFNPAEDKLYTTNWSNNKVVVYDNADPHPILRTIATSSGRNESPVFAADKTFYVSHALGGSIDHYDSAGTVTKSAMPSTGSTSPRTRRCQTSPPVCPVPIRSLFGCYLPATEQAAFWWR